MRKKKKIPKTSIIGITGRLKPFVFDPCQSTWPAPIKIDLLPINTLLPTSNQVDLPPYVIFRLATPLIATPMSLYELRFQTMCACWFALWRFMLEMYRLPNSGLPLSVHRKWIIKLQLSRNLIIPRQSYGRTLIFTYSVMGNQGYDNVCCFERTSFYFWI